MGIRITYRTLAKLIDRMSDEQKDCDVTAEVFDGENTECFAASLRICNDDHDSLDDHHPVLFVDQCTAPDPRVDDIDMICKEIDLS